MVLKVNSSNVTYTKDAIVSDYEYQSTNVSRGADGQITINPTSTKYQFKTETTVPKLGVMLVGLGGNNGTTVTGGILANKLNINWRVKEGARQPNYWGSVTQASTFNLGFDAQGQPVHVPVKDVMPMVNPNDIVVGGWDINSMNLADAMQRAGVFAWDLQRQLIPHMKDIVPLPSIYYPDFIAANQEDRADNTVTGRKACWEHVEQIRNDIKEFKSKNGLDKVIILWTANTERFADVTPGVHDTYANLEQAIKNGHEEVAPSQIFAIASILEGCSYINGSPQNTFVPGVLELARREKVYVGGDDFKSGQTKIKSVLVDFLVGAGIKPVSIVSYNHLGNNDGKNLSSAKQFRSKEISKSNVVDDVVESNDILYKQGEHPDHCVVIKYVPYVGDSKRALDEYTSEIFMGGKNTISMHNTCEDSLLAAPLILDLIIMTEIMERIQYKTAGMTEYANMDSILTILSYLLKAPLTPEKVPCVNALFKQRSCIENIFRACIGLPPQNDMLLEHKTQESRVVKGEQ